MVIEFKYNFICQLKKVNYELKQHKIQFRKKGEQKKNWLQIEKLKKMKVKLNESDGKWTRNFSSYKWQNAYVIVI